MKCLLLLFATICLLLCVSGNTDIVFEGFTPDTEYTYYTNGVNVYTQLTCVATSNTYTDINTTWIDVTGNTYTDTGSSVLRFEDIATEINWRDERDYLCRAVYQTDPVMYKDSHRITVRIKYNTTITVSHGDITHIRDIADRNNVYIPVMTENVMISCDADSALWNYSPTGLSPQSDVPNPLTIDLFTLQYATTYFCTNTDIYNDRIIVKMVTLKAYGSGIYKQQQQEDTYTQLTEGESVYITEDTTLVCVSSIPHSSTWHYSNTSTGVEERLIEGTVVINSRGFLTLSLYTTSRVGHYICRTKEVTEDTYVIGNAIHRIIVSVPIVTTTTPIPTTSALTTTEPTDTTQTATKSTTTSEIIVQQTTQSTSLTTTTTTTNGTRTELEDTTPPYPIIGLTVGVLFILMLVIVVVILIVAFVVQRRKGKRSGYTKQIQTNNTEETTTDINNNKEYVNLPNLPTKPVPPSNTKKPVYKKLLQTDTPITSPIESPPEDKDGYMTLDQLEGSIGAGGESNPCVEEKVVPNDEFQYENVRPSLYESTTTK
eukprot:TRINITY_DN131_c0_g1_i4.p1 TRINITY_DN131_c0_g1~~TRINITY_DN131_c0_g1_i4.p1  ORF type:complete len:543 (-),score=119.79 TRINITY_DN131_c0_g1_i4:298-1926(-)